MCARRAASGRAGRRVRARGSRGAYHASRASIPVGARPEEDGTSRQPQQQHRSPEDDGAAAPRPSMRIDREQSNGSAPMHRSPRLASPGGSEDTTEVSRIPSTLSVAAVDVVVACRQAATSPSHSVLTLTPGRTRNIDQDMEALRLSRQDNPFLQVLASKENLVETIEESESDDAILMSQEFGDTDPLTLAQVHEHLVRSPPPASWTRSPVFHFPHPQDSPSSRSEPGGGGGGGGGGHCSRVSSSPSSRSAMLRREHEHHHHHHQSRDTETRDRHSHTFSLLNPTPIRSLSEVRRLHRSAEDSVQLMSSE